jgi:hypothetical protein
VKTDPNHSPPHPWRKPASFHRFSQDLELLLHHAAGRDLSIAEIEQVLQGRGVAILILVLDIPFMLPVPNPFSTVFGAAIILLALRLIFAGRSLLPGFVLRRHVPHAVLKRVTEWGVWISRKMERVLRPRLRFVHDWPAMKTAIGVGIVISALVLAVPLVIPNILPAAAVLLLTVGMVEEDGLVILCGYAVCAASCAYVAALLLLGHLGWQELAGKFFAG